MSDEVNRYFDTARRIGNKQRFERLSRRELAQMNDKALAQWQAAFSPGEAGWKLAEFEWQRRLTAAQIKAVRLSAFIGVVGTLFGAMLGTALTLYFADPASHAPRGTEPHAEAPQHPDKRQKPLEPRLDDQGSIEAVSSHEPQP